MSDSQGFVKHIERNHETKEWRNAIACELRTSLNLDLLCVAENGVGLELRRTATSQNCHSCQFADKRGERGYYDENDVVLCVN